MKAEDFSTTITVDTTAHEAFELINNVSQWWTENLVGHSKESGDEFTVRFGDVHMSTQKLVEVIPDKKIVWLITQSNLSFIKNKLEWTNTKVSFDIAERDGKTEITFTHIGLVPQIECYNSCTNAWSHYINGSLFKLLTKGKEELA